MKRFEYLTKEEIDRINNWYIKQEKSIEIYRIMDKNPQFFADAIHRNRITAKRTNALLLMSMSENNITKLIFLKSFTKIVVSINDLVVFIDQVKNNRGTGKIIKKAVNSWFKNKTVNGLKKEFESNIGNTKFKNIDILHMFHIKPWNKEISNLLKNVVEAEK